MPSQVILRALHPIRPLMQLRLLVSAADGWEALSHLPIPDHTNTTSTNAKPSADVPKLSETLPDCHHPHPACPAIIPVHGPPTSANMAKLLGQMGSRVDMRPSTTLDAVRMGNTTVCLPPGLEISGVGCARRSFHTSEFVACSTSGSSSSSNKASAAVYRTTGNPAEVVKIRKLKVDKCEFGEIEVKFLMAPINPADINTIEGRYPLSPALPGVPGHEGVGEVIDVGPQVTGIQPGDWVVPLVPAQGTWRTRGVFKASAFHKIEKGIHLEAAAALCVNPPTALLMLEDFVKLQPGDVIVQNGANSAVGQMVIQLAHAMDVKTINIIRERPNWDEVVENLKAQGADVVTTEARAKEDAKAAGLKGAVLGLNCVGGTSSLVVGKLMREGGVHVTYGGMSLEAVQATTSLLVFKDLVYKGFWLSGRWAVDHGYKAKGELLDRLVALIKKGDLKIEATKSTIFPLEKVHEALCMAQRELRGSKVYIKMNE